MMIIKAMTVGEILDNTFKLFKDQFKSYMSIVLIAALITLGLGIFALILYYLFGQIAAVISMVITLILAIGVYMAMVGGVIKKASEQISGREISGMEALQFGKSKLWVLFLGMLLYSIVIAFGGILLLIPGIYLAVSCGLFMQIVTIEEIGAWSALKRSRELISGSWWRCFGIMFLITILVSILSVLVQLPVLVAIKLIFGQSMFGEIVRIIFDVCVSSLITPLSLIAATLLYYDLRVRKENLDLQMMVNDLTDTNNPGISGN